MLLTPCFLHHGELYPLWNCTPKQKQILPPLNCFLSGHSIPATENSLIQPPWCSRPWYPFPLFPFEPLCGCSSHTPYTLVPATNLPLTIPLPQFLWAPVYSPCPVQHQNTEQSYTGFDLTPMTLKQQCSSQHSSMGLGECGLLKTDK